MEDARLIQALRTRQRFVKDFFNNIHRKFTFQGKKVEPGTYFLDSWLISAIYIQYVRTVLKSFPGS